MSSPNSHVENTASSDPKQTDEPSGEPYSIRRSLSSRGSSIGRAARRLSREFESSRPLEGFTAAASDVASTLVAGQSREHSPPPEPSTPEKMDGAEDKTLRSVASDGVAPSEEVTAETRTARVDARTEPFENGYHFPPKYSWQESLRHGTRSFLKFFFTPMGFFWTIYGLNVVAWGGMLFLLLCNAAPAMCYPSCDDIDSPRRKWVEYDSQILTALFCVPAFGFIWWRFRDFWLLLKYRIQGDEEALRRLAGIHVSWFRLKGSEQLAPEIGVGHIPANAPELTIPIPDSSMAPAPLTGTRAPPTAVWKMDFVVWSMVLNTWAQAALCGIMWGINRFDRPSWTTGFLVAIACIIAMIGGLVMFLEGKKVKSIEGVPLSEEDERKLADDLEKGVRHYPPTTQSLVWRMIPIIWNI
jgi:hypothetical protein